MLKNKDTYKRRVLSIHLEGLEIPNQYDIRELPNLFQQQLNTRIQKLKEYMATINDKRYLPMYQNKLDILSDTYDSYYVDYNRIYGIRNETDEEMNQRIAETEKRKLAAKAAAIKRKMNKEERERKLFLELKKKYDQ
jgi:hypothetical protein